MIYLTIQFLYVYRTGYTPRLEVSAAFMYRYLSMVVQPIVVLFIIHNCSIYTAVMCCSSRGIVGDG